MFCHLGSILSPQHLAVPAAFLVMPVTIPCCGFMHWLAKVHRAAPLFCILRKTEETMKKAPGLRKGQRAHSATVTGGTDSVQGRLM